MSEILTPCDVFLNIESSGSLCRGVLDFQREGCGDSCPESCRVALELRFALCRAREISKMGSACGDSPGGGRLPL